MGLLWKPSPMGIINYMKSKQRQKHQSEEEKEWSSLFSHLKEYIFQKSLDLGSSLHISLLLASILLTLAEFQKFAIVSRLTSNPTIQSIYRMEQVDTISRYLLLDLRELGEMGKELVTLLLMAVQLVVTVSYLLPIGEEGILKMASKMIVLTQITLTIPCILTSMESLVNQVNIVESTVLLALTTINVLIYNFTGVECSFERENDNVLVRVPYSLTLPFLQLVTIAIFPLFNAFAFSTSFLIYLTASLAIFLAEWSMYLRSYTFFRETLVRLKGVLISVNISAHVCYLSIQFVSNAIIENNILIFISAFSLFLGNFFLVYRNYIIKGTVINLEIKTQHQITTFGLFYWHCYVYVAEKKNQLYLSSLLKKHMNECFNPHCCCKHRELLYDNSAKTYGNPGLQPHFDRIFIRHYIRSILSKGYDEHPRSTMLVFLLATFDIEALEMVTHTMQLIRKLVRMEQKKHLSLMEEYLLFCLRKKTRSKIKSMNAKLGNLDLESVKLFDEKTTLLHVKLRDSVKNYFSIWRYLGHSKFNQLKLFKVCKDSLETMFCIEELYTQLKRINNQSTELRTVMIFYAQMVLHDIHLLSEIKKEVKTTQEHNLISTNLELNSLQLFGTKAASMITQENGKIKWASRNAHQLFEYPRDEFLALTINSLMPKYFADHHDQYIQKWKETGHHIKLNRVCYLWGSNKEGYCFSLLIYVKVVPLPHEQDYAFFASIQKVEGQLAVICSPRGEIYGAGKLFPSTIGVSPRLLQELRPNLQVFMPHTFDYFLQYFFAQNPKFKAQKRVEQVRRQGYFPEGLEIVIRELAADRSIFARNHRHQDNFEKEYLNFIKQRMQELTCSINGEYISFLINVEKVVELNREKRKILSLKFTNPKKDNIERYYNDLQKMIRRLQELTEEEETSNKKYKPAHKKTRSDFFKAFLNPRRVKRLLQEENMGSIKQEEEENKGQTLKSDSCLKSDSVIGSRTRKSACTIVAHRKKLALGAQVEIKNERVRYNLWRMKKILLEEGVISRYTYNLLIGKQNQAYNFQSLARLEPSATDVREETSKAITKNYEQALWEEGKESIESDSQVGLGQCEENDNETFNSASSSATFISMTSQVKIFKEKLRSLNSPVPLLILNVVVVIVVVAGIGGLGFETLKNRDNCDNGYRQFQSIMEGNQILSMILEGQMNIQNYNANTSNPYFQLKRNYLLERATVLLKRQLSRRMEESKISPLLMKYLTFIIIDHNTPLEVKEFFNIVINQIVKNQFSHILKYFIQTFSAINQHSSSNIFFDTVSSDLLLVFALYGSAAVVLLLLTLPVLRSVKTKINQIYDLLTKLSANEKYQYFKHFWKMNDEIKKIDVINHEEIIRITLLLEQDFCMFRREMHSQDSLDETQRKEKEKREKEEEQNIGGSRSIYLKVLGTYCILVIALLFYFLFSAHYVSLNDQAYHTFIQAFNQKSSSTINFINCNFQLMGYAHEAECYSPTMPIVQALYQTYHLPIATDTYKSYLYEYSTGNVCDKLQQNDDTVTFGPEQIALCLTLNGGTFKQGAFNSMYYVQRKIEQRVKEYYAARNNTPNDESHLTYPDYFLTDEYFQINLGFFYGSVMHYHLFEQMNQEMKRQVDSLKGYLQIAAVVTICLLLVFLGVWVYLYLQLAENASYINAFLLLIPFKILTENPYIKLYIRNEFDYKAANY